MDSQNVARGFVTLRERKDARDGLDEELLVATMVGEAAEDLYLNYPLHQLWASSFVVVPRNFSSRG